MKYRILLVFLAVALVVSLAAFAGCAKEDEAPPVTEEEWQWPEKLILVTLSLTSPTYGALVGWTTPFAADTGIKVRIVTEDNAQKQHLWVKNGRFFGRAPHQSRAALYGAKGWTHRDGGPMQSRIFAACGLSYWSFASLGDSGLKTPYDIKPGMSVVMMTVAEEPQQSVFAVLAWAQIDPEDINFMAVAATAQSARAIQDGKADFTLAYISSSKWLEVEASPKGLQFIALDAAKDPEGAERFMEAYPYTAFGLAKGTGPASAMGVPMVESLVPNMTSADSDPELVYRLIKWLDINYDQFSDSHSWNANITIDNLVKLAENHYEPLHEGSVRYLKELGLWTDELDVRWQYNIEQMTLWVDAYDTAMDRADQQGIDVDAENDEWQELWENYRASLNLPLLVYKQGPEREQPSYTSYYDWWNRVKPF